ncbi:hypothetical protein [uncultured Paracoccus sp.]|uniref:hypothetical protein n=1 Tax=uncultured Paracoccus sp. TaxID=189685 RepID=UPI00261BC5AD|nr:hypothetical protein [uncultured Paracoccus sp.]
MTRNLTLTALICVSLAACGTPRERCEARNTREYRTIANLLEEVQTNLDRGYAWEQRETRRVVWRDCRDLVRRRDGTTDVVYRPCLRSVPDVERYRVPIDPAAETRKRDNLVARLKALEPSARQAVLACRAAYPE